MTKRIDAIDALRGLSVVLMVVHHALYDAVAFLGAPGWLFSNPVFDVLHILFAGTFIFLSGLSSQFSRSNIRRGLKVIAIALGISLVTWAMKMPIWFGVLHLLGLSMLLYGLTRGLWDGLPRVIAPLLLIALIIGSRLAILHIPVRSDSLWIFGWYAPGFISYDYFPLFPWFFVFLLGTWAGVYVRDGALPEGFYTFTVPFFPQVGRRSLLIYILHQPVLYGIFQLLYLAFFRQTGA